MIEEFIEAATYADKKVLTKLLKKSPSLINAHDEDGFTALHMAVGEHDQGTIMFLLDNGADPNAQNVDGISPLHLAAYPEWVPLLIRYGGNVELRSSEGSTPLIVHAAEADSDEVMRALLTAGADPNARDAHGNTALDLASAREETNKVSLLKEFGAR